MINKNELLFKIDIIIKYLKNNNGYNYKLYNHICPDIGEPDSNIVEYAQDVENICMSMIKIMEMKQDNIFDE